jgi:hypothetical protein
MEESVLIYAHPNAMEESVYLFVVVATEQTPGEVRTHVKRP